jgi:D-alanyl-D-alanine-carboxypeptidase/D-alanyl-D-alanine-endopeptidase
MRVRRWHKHFYAVAGALALGAALQTSVAQQPSLTLSDSALLELLKLHVKENRAAGVVVGLLTPTGDRRVIAHGNPGVGRLPLDGNSVFKMASITKSFLGTLLAVLVMDSSVALDQPVQQLLPSSVTMPTFAGKEITLRHLSTHTSALARDATADSSGSSEDFTAEKLYSFVSGLTLPQEPGTKWQYSNVGAALLGHALANRAGKPFAQLLSERILAPLGIELSGVELTPHMQAHLVQGHDPDGAPLPDTRGAPAYVPAGGLRSTANDLLTFIAANIDAHVGLRTDELGRAMALAHRVHYEQPRPDTTPILMGLNWYLRPIGTDTIIWHGGGVQGYGTFIGFIPSRRTGVVVLTNSGRGDAYNLGFHLLDPSLPRVISTPQQGIDPAQVITYSGIVLVVALTGWGIVRWRRRRAP